MNEFGTRAFSLLRPVSLGKCFLPKLSLNVSGQDGKMSDVIVIANAFQWQTTFVSICTYLCEQNRMKRKKVTSDLSHPKK